MASVDGRGGVAFWAALEGGGSGVFLGEPGEMRCLAAVGAVYRAFLSHPAINKNGQWCIFAEQLSGAQGLLRGGPGGEHFLPLPAGFSRIGPLGPTMNDRGEVALRATRAGAAHEEAILVTRDGQLAPVAATGEPAPGGGRITAIQGLPLIDDRGDVVFRADLSGGRQAIYRAEAGRLVCLIDTASELAWLGRFPCAGRGGRLVLAAGTRDGGSGVFAVDGGTPTRLIDGRGRFESIRGALAGGPHLCFFATPPGGTLGVYDGAGRCLVSLGEARSGAVVVDLALNPVSIDERGQIALRLALAGGRQQIVRADLASLGVPGSIRTG